MPLGVWDNVWLLKRDILALYVMSIILSIADYANAQMLD